MRRALNLWKGIRDPTSSKSYNLRPAELESAHIVWKTNGKKDDKTNITCLDNEYKIESIIFVSN